MKNKSNIPQLRFSEFHDEWQVEILSNIAHVTAGQSPLGDTYNTDGQGLPLYQGKKDFGPIYTTTSGTWTTKPEKIANKFDILLSVRAPVGAINYASEDMAIGRGLSAIHPINDIDRRFLFLSLERKKKTFKRLSRGSTFEAILMPDVKSLSMVLPRLSEQEKIADFLTAVDERIEKIEKKVELLKQYKKGVIQKIFTQKVRFKDENGNPYPDWEEKKLGEIVKNLDSKRKPISSEHRTKGIYPYYGANGIVDYVDDYILEGAYVLVAEDGVVDTTNYPIHITKGRFWVNNHAHVLDGIGVTNDYLFYAMQNTRFMRYITGSAQTKLNGQVLAKIEVLLPNAEEQRKIANFLTNLDEKITLEENKLTKAKEFKKGLLQRMFV